jgi:hypothetical protein
MEKVMSVTKKFYHCGSCNHHFTREWSTIEKSDLSTCPCEKCGAMAMETPERWDRPGFCITGKGQEPITFWSEEPYQIFKGPTSDDELIGNLPLSVASSIHGADITRIDYGLKHIFVRKISISKMVKRILGDDIRYDAEPGD